MKNIIKSTYLQRVQIMDFFEVMNIIAVYVGKEDLETLKLKAVGTEFINAFHSFDKSVKQANKTVLTEKILKTDDIRDKILVGFKSVISGMILFPKEDVAEAATVISILVDKYGKNIQEMGQRNETGIIHNLIDDLKSDKHKQQVTVAKLDDWVVELEKANIDFENLYIQRSEEQSEFVVGLAKKERENLQNAFEKLCRNIEAYATIEGEAAYKPLANKINEEVQKAQQNVKARQTKNKE